MDSNNRPGDEKKESQSITDDMLNHCSSLNALAHSLNNQVPLGLNDNLEIGQLWSEIETLEQQVHKIRGHIEKIRANTQSK